MMLEGMMIEVATRYGLESKEAIDFCNMVERFEETESYSERNWMQGKIFNKYKVLMQD